MGAVQEEMSTTTTSWKSRFGGSRRMSKDNSLQGSDDTATNETRNKKKGKMRGRLSRLLPASHHSQSKLVTSSRDPSPVEREPTPPVKTESPETKASSTSSTSGEDQVVPATATAETTTTRPPRAASNSPEPPTENQVPDQEDEEVQEKRKRKERDGFCRRVDTYDGQVVVVDCKPTYELGNYLGGGVAGVVYEGHRLRPMNEYPVRGGVLNETPVIPPPKEVTTKTTSFLCGDSSLLGMDDEEEQPPEPLLAPPQTPPQRKSSALTTIGPDFAIETAVEDDNHVIVVDQIDAPSRSIYAARAASIAELADETVAIKILNPVGFRIMPVEQTRSAVVVRKGQLMTNDVMSGKRPMEEKHVWWLVNPNSRNLRTLQKAPSDKIERGSPERGIRLSLVAAYVDPTTKDLRELPLTRCIEIWGHVPFSASDQEFEDMMQAIERVNAGHAASPILLNQQAMDRPPSRVGTDLSNASTLGDDTTIKDDATNKDDTKSVMSKRSVMSNPAPLSPQRTGLFRAAQTSRTSVFCEALNAYIAIPSVPPKYLRWLRQRRAATKEIRNMMLIGRHRNVVHLYEVLEHIQDSKSTMFLILELVRGGELFDLISSSASKENSGDDDGNQEAVMRKFFRELASGIHYCHANGIAHRDLKPENLLVHNGPNGQCTLKIADFGLSATFMHDSDLDTITVDDLTASPASVDLDRQSTMSRNRSKQIEIARSKGSNSSDIASSLTTMGHTAWSYLTCGAVDDVLGCNPSEPDDQPVTSPLRRMTSVVGSPHYVAPEIISQHDDDSKSKKRKGPGYDGTKADVWSAGVILYAMLFRSLPFGEDLLRCPRFQSFRKWYDEARKRAGRRSAPMEALNPLISDRDREEMLGPHWFFPADSSWESRDLIVAMLNPNAEERLSIEMVLQHPWFRLEENEMNMSSF